MATAPQKTNAARLLDAAGINYTLVAYQVDEEHLEAAHVAEQLGEDLDQVFKTLVLRGDRNGLFVCVMPGRVTGAMSMRGASAGRSREAKVSQMVAGARVWRWELGVWPPKQPGSRRRAAKRKTSDERRVTSGRFFMGDS